jgi:hypothetical protein
LFCQINKIVHFFLKKAIRIKYSILPQVPYYTYDNKFWGKFSFSSLKSSKPSLLLWVFFLKELQIIIYQTTMSSISKPVSGSEYHRRRKPGSYLERAHSFEKKNNKQILYVHHTKSVLERIELRR